MHRAHNEPQKLCALKREEWIAERGPLLSEVLCSSTLSHDDHAAMAMYLAAKGSELANAIKIPWRFIHLVKQLPEDKDEDEEEEERRSSSPVI